ncbi:hypothetical protein Y1Q_0007792 [Alligator mississippiensis]|uniref:Uncharacterized protein n=1 Tax=Alligator mississippiensis TaxID=8496 RepID=A0A151N778_ALLMI|nr:hypothetical protein Y1Q_0007792 [Alligator mississippiensis]
MFKSIRNSIYAFIPSVYYFGKGFSIIWIHIQWVLNKKGIRTECTSQPLGHNPGTSHLGKLYKCGLHTRLIHLYEARGRCPWATARAGLCPRPGVSKVHA